MKTIKTAIIAAGFAVLAAAPALAEPTPGNYAFVNLPAVVQNSAAGKAANAEMEIKGKQFQAELAKEDKALDEAKAAFEKEFPNMDRPTYETKRKELQSRIDKAEGILRDRKRALQFAKLSSRDKITTEANKIIAAMAEEKNYAAVFTQEAVILAARDLDITKEVISRLDSKVSKITVDWSGGVKKK
ncbi:MAG: OmpH family outer membrane protein [Alphaproteobacteria bacterium]